MEVDNEAEAGPRLAMLHAWVWMENPDGTFAQHNWALPFARSTISVPPDVPEAAARALSLASGNEPFYSEMLLSGDESRAAVDALMAKSLT